MKRVFGLIMLLLIGFGSIACEVDFKVSESSKKELYTSGDEIVVTVKVVLTHRKCDIAIEDSKIGATGGKIVGATKWKQTATGVYQRKLKVKVSDDDKSEVKLVCQRTCDKEGGSGQLVLKKKSN